MVHDHMSVKSETGRATIKLIGTMLGGVLVIASFIAYWIASWSGAGEESARFYRDVPAAIGAILLAGMAGHIDLAPFSPK